MSTENCSGCRFWVEIVLDEDQKKQAERDMREGTVLKATGECRNSLPTLLPFSDKNYGWTVFHWPIIDFDKWCGQFEERRDQEGQEIS